jgi:hypothetical protein
MYLKNNGLFLKVPLKPGGIIMMDFQDTGDLIQVLEQKLHKYTIDKIARETEFLKRKPRKIAPLPLLLSLCLMVLTKANSLSGGAATLGLLQGTCLSKQALHKRMNRGLLSFLQACLAMLLGSAATPSATHLSELMSSPFKRILLQDRTVLNLPARLASFFPGGRNQTHRLTAAAKVQVLFDLLQEQFIHFAITPFTVTEQTAASWSLPFLKAGDLLIRDLGYFVLPVFQKLQQRSIFYLSRLKYGVTVLESIQTTPLDLCKLLKRQGSVDLQVRLALQHGLLTRLVAIPLSPAEAARRRRKAKTNRDRRCQPSQAHLYLLGWNIFITNVEATTLSVPQIAHL